jgi:hypothetical protein
LKSGLARASIARNLSLSLSLSFSSCCSRDWARRFPFALAFAVLDATKQNQEQEDHGEHATDNNAQNCGARKP